MKLYFAIDPSKTVNKIDDFEICSRGNWVLTHKTVVGRFICLSYSNVFNLLEQNNLLTDETFICEGELQDIDAAIAVQELISGGAGGVPVKILNVVRVSSVMPLQKVDKAIRQYQALAKEQIK